MNLKRYFYAMLIMPLFTFLVGCTLEISKKSFNFDDSQNSNYYLSQADNSSGSVKVNWQLLAIRALIKENKFSQADALLSNLPFNLNTEQQKEKFLSAGEIAVIKRLPFNLNQLTIGDLTDTQLYRYYNIKLGLDINSKDINAQAHDYLELDKYVPETEKRKLLNNTWNFFHQLKSNEIRKVLVYEHEITLQGWVDLAYAYQNASKESVLQDDDTPDTITTKSQNQELLLKQAIIDWSTQYPNHPAKEIVSVLIGEQALSVDVNAKKVALLLPLNGTSRIFGETIRQGYINGIKFFPQEPQQNVIVLDTTSESMDTLVQQAKEQNIELIVGPLLKEEVVKIQELAPAIPVLALNKIDNTTPSDNKMCYFALSPEDEAKDAANHIYSQNKVKPLLLVPQTDLGQRVAQSFATQWSQLSTNSSQAYVQYFGNTKTLSDHMNNNVGINLSGSPILINDTSPEEKLSAEFDAIYVYSSYDELTLIKPMLDMGANKTIGNSSAVTLYSSSKSHVANASNDFNYDMNKTQYADIPMIVNQRDNTNIPSNVQQDYSLMRLYAMGIDAWRLANRFNQLNSNQPNLLDGMTGKLSTGNQCEVSRSLSWQQYIYGEAKSDSNSE
ncbi:penicillin-binding protein activator [Gilliamella mensalis]|uniref:penicillin-binding protein activator n=1 Tax=Gilliamella mensalis TaxID=1908520 RepID=UPI000A14919D|nr:penicillin-binding protein activator [Gilliamella mensalis]